MNQFNESSNKIKKSCDIEIVKLKDDTEIAKFQKFYKSVWPNKEPCIHPLNDGRKVALLCSNGDSPYFSGRWFELYLSHLCRQGARYWKELGDFIANYDVRAHNNEEMP